MTASSTSGVRATLERRADLRSALRSLFDAAGFLEVDTPTLAGEVLPEAHIDPIRAITTGRLRFLQASPEAHMKRLLAAGSGAIYQFARAFRDGERGNRHDFEFLLLEWYAPGNDLDTTAALLERVCSTTLGSHGIDRLTCREAFTRWAGVDPLTSNARDLTAAARRAGIDVPEDFDRGDPGESFDRVFELLLAEVVGPRLGWRTPTMLEAWPVSQAAFARLEGTSPATARRFELFIRGIEVANGWEEETCVERILDRIDAANRIRQATGREPLPLPERLLEAHRGGMPEGVGCALGFDRLAMLAAGCDSIDTVRCFTSDDA